jgi:hypothetical protein
MAERREKRECKAIVLEPDAAGIDIGAEEIYVAVPLTVTKSLYACSADSPRFERPQRSQ